MSRSKSRVQELDQAYRKAIYRVLDDSPFDLRVDCFSARLAAWQRRAGVDHSALLTACNPGSQRLPDECNQQRQQALIQCLEGRIFLYTESIDPEGLWPVEQGVIVAGMKPDDARQLADQWEQLAWLQMGPDTRPELMYIDDVHYKVLKTLRR